MARGRQANRPRQIPARGWYDIAMRLKHRIAEDRLSLIAAGVAFYGLLSLFPAITALLAIGGLVLDPVMIVSLIDRLSGVAPAEALSIIGDQAREVSAIDGLGLAILVSIGLAFWSASRGVNVMFIGLNVAYKEDEQRGFIQKNLHVLGITAVLLVGAIVASVAVAALPFVLGFLELGRAGEILAQVGAYLVLAALLMFGLALLYRFGPSRADAQWAWITPGALFSCVISILASIGFTIYVANFANYNESFGALGGAIILLMWLWITAFVILIGGQLNAEMEHQTAVDTTTGEPKPMGERGAYMADTLGRTRETPAHSEG